MLNDITTESPAVHPIPPDDVIAVRLTGREYYLTLRADGGEYGPYTHEEVAAAGLLTPTE